MVCNNHFPMFSIVIPVYGVEKYLNQCVDSLLSQSFKDYEIILVDDGSPDRCPEICDEYYAIDERIRVIHQKNGGLSNARNTGIQSAKGNFLLFIDSDDFWDDNYALQRIADCVIDENPDMVIWDSKILYDDTGVISAPKNHFPSVDGLSTDDAIKALVGSSKLEISATIRAVRRKIIQESNLRFQEGVTTEDIEWTISLLEIVDSIRVIDSAHELYRVHRPGSITGSIGISNIKNYISVFNSCFRIIEEGNQSRKDALLNYMAYQFILLCAQSYKIRRHPEFKAIVFQIHEIDKTGIMDYRYHPRVKRIGKLYDIVGYRGLILILGFYLKHLH